jgi:hypothetical protein
LSAFDPLLPSTGQAMKGSSRPVVDVLRPLHTRSQMFYSKHNQEKPRTGRGS